MLFITQNAPILPVLIFTLFPIVMPQSTFAMHNGQDEIEESAEKSLNASASSASSSYTVGSHFKSESNGDKILSKAEMILELNNRGNREDLIYLWSLLDPICKKIDQDKKKFEQIKEDWIQVLKRDLGVFAELKAKLGTSEGSYALRSSLTKLVGTGMISGLLADSIRIFEDAKECQSLEPKWENLIDKKKWDELEKIQWEEQEESKNENYLTVLKNALLYANLSLGQLSWSEVRGKLKLIYPETFPPKVTTQTIPLLCCSTTQQSQLDILIPHQGYIFGGNGAGQGLDCSSFVCQCVDCPRMSTLHLAAIWDFNFYGNQSKDPDVQTIVMNNKDRFKAIPMNEAEVAMGDIIVWRSSGGGHVAIFKKWIGANRFIGIDDNRSDDKKIEGVGYREFLFDKSDKKTSTYVLRTVN